MKVSIVLLIISSSFVIGQEKYDSSYDNYDITELLNNKRLMKNYTLCLIDKGPCVAAIAKFKEALPEILETTCAKCTEKQLSLGKQLVGEIIKTQPKLWEELVKKYDPEGQYTTAFEKKMQEN